MGKDKDKPGESEKDKEAIRKIKEAGQRAWEIKHGKDEDEDNPEDEGKGR